MKNNLKETISALALVSIAILLLNPFDFWMPNIMVMCALAIILVLFGLFASFILREKSLDERDSAHKTIAGRNAFLAGSAVLLLGIVIEEYRGMLDPWLVIAFLVMIITKIFTRIWSDRNL